MDRILLSKTKRELLAHEHILERVNKFSTDGTNPFKLIYLESNNPLHT